MIALNASGDVLLVRHSYHLQHLWMLPGGGLAREENPVDGATRELVEETGCTLIAPKSVGTVTLNHGTWTNIVELVCGEAVGAPLADGREIADAAFHPIIALPEMTATSTLRLIEFWLEARTPQNGNSA